MILYLDTSALIKAYVSEDGTHDVLQAMRAAEAVATHLIAYVEAQAAFARMIREKAIAAGPGEALRKEFSRDWENYIRVGVDEPLVQRAASLAEAFALRAYDSVHLAAADLLSKQADTRVAFACFDRKLSRAATVLGLPRALADA